MAWHRSVVQSDFSEDAMVPPEGVNPTPVVSNIHRHVDEQIKQLVLEIDLLKRYLGVVVKLILDGGS